MKNFNRENPLFSLCGLNCGLCTMYLDHYCPGCGAVKGIRHVRLQNAAYSVGKWNIAFNAASSLVNIILI